MHNIAQVTLQIITKPGQNAKINTCHFVLAIFLKLRSLYPGAENDHIFTDPMLQPELFQRDNNAAIGSVFRFQTITS